MMELIFYICAAVSFPLVALTVGYGIWGSRQIRFLRDTPPATGDELPKITLIAPARNEERAIEEAIRSQLALEYPRLEVVAVNDRSTDRTGEILDQIAAEDPRLQVVHLTELPAGWLGKNYANHRAAEQASGDYLLFTDADIVMQPRALRHAIAYLLAHKLDHLVMTPTMRRATPIVDAYVVTFLIYFNSYFRPWKAKDPRSKAHIGVGAFNLVRASAYHACGGHEAIRMRPDDDLKLGKLLKKNGFRQELVYGNEMIEVQWYAKMSEVIEGLMKNTFSGVEYNPIVTITASVVMVLLNLWPLVGLGLTEGITWWLHLATTSTLVGGFLYFARCAQVPCRLVFFFPICVLLHLYIIWRAMILTYLHDGISWRGTHYPLAELKANRV